MRRLVWVPVLLATATAAAGAPPPPQFVRLALGDQGLWVPGGASVDLEETPCCGWLPVAHGHADADAVCPLGPDGNACPGGVAAGEDGCACPDGSHPLHPAFADDRVCGAAGRCVWDAEICVTAGTVVESATREPWPAGTCHPVRGIASLSVDGLPAENIAAVPGWRHELAASVAAITKVKRTTRLPRVEPVAFDAALPEQAVAKVRKLMSGTRPRVQLTVVSTVGFGCDCAPLVLGAFTDVAGSPDVFVLPTGDHPARFRVPGGFRLTGRYTGARQRLDAWAAASGVPTSMHAGEHREGVSSPVFAVESWCYVPPADGRERAYLDGLPAESVPPRIRWCAR